MGLIIDALNAVADLRPSTIEFITSAEIEGVGGEVVNLGFTVQGIKLKENRTGQINWLDFVGIGAGLGIGLPAGGSLSTEDFPSFGSKILKGPTNWGRLELSDLCGMSQVYCIGAGAGPGISSTLIFFNTFPIVPPLLFKAAILVEGVTLASPGAGVMLYMGMWFIE
jgi:hypothetical protein